MNYQSFCEALPPSKRQSDPLWCRYVLRPLSFPLAWWMYRAGVSPNATSLLGLILGVGACCLLVFPSLAGGLVAAIVLCFVALLDCVDGNLARATKQTGPNGEWIDAIVGYALYAVLPIALGIRAGLIMTRELEPIPVLLGGFAASFNVFARLVHQKFESAHLRSGIPTTGSELKSGKVGWSKRISGEVGLCGFMMPALVVAILFQKETYFLGFYGGFYTLVAVAVTGKMVIKVMRMKPREGNYERN